MLVWVYGAYPDYKAYCGDPGGINKFANSANELYNLTFTTDQIIINTSSNNLTTKFDAYLIHDTGALLIYCASSYQVSININRVYTAEIEKYRLKVIAIVAAAIENFI